MSIQHPQNLRQAVRDLTILHPFWATVVLHFEIKPDLHVPTFATNGKTIFYNPKLAEKWSVALNMFALAHEAGHVVLRHLDRPFQPQPGCGKIFGMEKGKPVYWHRKCFYTAGDYLINDMLKKSGFTLWDKCLWEARFDVNDWTTEKVYHQLMKESEEKQQQQQSSPQQAGDSAGGGESGEQPEDDPGGEGDPEHKNSPNFDEEDDTEGLTKDSEPGDEDGDSDGNSAGAGDEEGEEEEANSAQTGDDVPVDKLGEDHVLPPADGFTEAETRDMVVRAMSIAKAQGKLPGAIEGLLKECTQPQYPVYRLLENFVDNTMKGDDSSWHRPNRNFMNRGIVLPGEYNETVDHVVVFADVSGSVPDSDISRFMRVTGDILRRLKPAKLTYGECDAAVTKFVTITKSSDWPKSFKVTGRGGTSFIPPFERLAAERIQPTCFVYLTDMYGSFPERKPGYPVLWVSTSKGVKAPFGITIELNQ